MMILAADTPIGQEFSGKPKVLTMQRIWAFSGGPFRSKGWPSENIHTDYDFAERMGLSTVYVSATQYLGYLTEHLIDLFGEQWLSTGKTCNLKFIAPVTEGDTIQVVSRVRSITIEKSDTRCILDVWCENQRGAKVLVGEAIGIIG
jgi:acyl dehydratase